MYEEFAERITARKMGQRCWIFVFVVSSVSFLAQLSDAGSASIYPCQGARSKHGEGVDCTHVKLPRSLCSACPLRDPTNEGKFKDCSNIMNPDSNQCKDELQKYVDANPCDTIRADAVKDLRNGNPSYNSRVIVEYVETTYIYI